MLRRVAQDLFWAGRYFERADCLARFVFAQRRLGLEVGPIGPDADAWLHRIASGIGDPSVLRRTAGEIDATKTIAQIVLAPDRETSIARCVARARENARSGRAYLSRETYESLNRLYLMLREFAPERTQWSFALQGIEQTCRVVSGYMADTVVRDDAWQVLHAGRHLERAFQAVRIVRAAAVDADGRPWVPGARVDPLAWGGLLRSCSAYEAYRKVYKGPIDPLGVLELLLLHPAFPRSLRGALGLLRENLVALGLVEAGSFRPSAIDARLNRLSASVAYGGMNSIREDGPARALERFEAELAAVAAALEELLAGVEPVPPRPIFPAATGGSKREGSLALILETTHSTRLRYPTPVARSTNAVRLVPADDGGQRRLAWAVTTKPAVRVRAYVDSWGNTVQYFTVREAHFELEITGRSRVETGPRSAPSGDVPWVAYGPASLGPLLDLTLQTPLTDRGTRGPRRRTARTRGRGSPG